MDCTLPLEILIEIACTSIESLVAMLALPPVARFFSNHRVSMINRFAKIVAVRYSTGITTEYYLHGNLHRYGDLPAIEYLNGSKEWYWMGKTHRRGGKPAIKYANGTKVWYWRGNMHREDGPAVVWHNGDKEWYWMGKRHRSGDLPAVERANGTKEWYWLGKHYRPPSYGHMYANKRK